MKIKNYLQFLNETESPPSAAPTTAPAPAPVSSQTVNSDSPAPDPMITSTDDQQSGTTTQTQPTDNQTQSTENKIGDLSNYDKPDVTKHSDTVKKMAQEIRNMDKSELIKTRNYISKKRGLKDPKSDIGIL